MDKVKQAKGLTPTRRRLIKGHENLALDTKQRERLIKKAEKHFAKFLTVLGYDLKNDPHLTDTPHRVTKAYVEEIFAGNFLPIPKITAFDDPDRDMGYTGIVTQTNISLKSMCSHHFLPFTGVAHISYIPGDDGKVIGLSKLNRIADYCARRPQVQERLTAQILNMVSSNIPGNKGVAVTIAAKHLCCSNRGIGHDSTMVTTQLEGGFFNNPSCKAEHLHNIQGKINLD